MNESFILVTLLDIFFFSKELAYYQHTLHSSFSDCSFSLSKQLGLLVSSIYLRPSSHLMFCAIFLDYWLQLILLYSKLGILKSISLCNISFGKYRLLSPFLNTHLRWTRFLFYPLQLPIPQLLPRAEESAILPETWSSQPFFSGCGSGPYFVLREILISYSWQYSNGSVIGILYLKCPPFRFFYQ